MLFTFQCFVFACVILHRSCFLIVLQHLVGWVDLQSPLIAQVAEILVVDEAFAVFVEELEDHELIFGAHLDLESFEALCEFSERDAVVEVSVEVAEGWTEGLEAFLDANP